MTPSQSPYDGQLKIWIVGVRDKNSRVSIWSQLWKPTGREWFGTRMECWEYIRTKIRKSNFEHLEYKPLRYGPAVKP